MSQVCFYPPIYMSVLRPIYHTLLITAALQRVLKLGSVSLSPPYFSQIVLVMQSPLQFHINFRISPSIFSTKAIGILIRFALNLWIALGSTSTLTVFSIPIHEPNMSFHLLRSTFLSFSSFVVSSVQISHLLG